MQPKAYIETSIVSYLATMENDPIIAEIHTIREALSRASDHDIRRIAEAAKVRQQEGGRKAVRLPPRQPQAIRKVS